MRRLFILTLSLGIFTSATGQDLVERICVEICSCIDTIENIDSLQSKLDRCVPESMDAVWNSMDDGNEDQYVFMDDTIRKTVDAVVSKLAYYCPKIKEFLLENMEAQYYRMSESEAANELYLAGNKSFESGDFRSAEKKYLKAIKADPGWVYPYDNLGLTYRNAGQYKKAVKYYEMSLEIYPQGSFALQNQAVAYTYLNDNEQALQNYNSMINLYPDNPEGFFGTAKVHYLNEDYEVALDFALYSHKLYQSLDSEYVKDTEKLISQIYGKMKELNMLDIFNEKVKQYGVSIDVN